jgi:hypothetical protein
MLGEEWSGSLFGNEGHIGFVVGQDTAGKLEVMERLLASHPGCTRPDDLWRGFGNVTGEFALSVKFGTALGGGCTLDTASVGELTPIGYKPAFAVR